jgi:hypothetical protein
MAIVPGRYSIEWAPRAETEIDEIRAFDARPILTAVNQLRNEAEVETRNREPLRAPLPELPEASWEARVGDHHVLHQVREGRIVRVLRVILKGRRTISEALGKTS